MSDETCYYVDEPNSAIVIIEERDMIAAMMLLAATTIGPYRNDFQMTSPVFGAFARMTDTVCPARRLRYLTPADLDGLEEGFEEQLPARLRRAIVARDRGLDGCANKLGGISCPAQHRLDAIRMTHLLPSFARYACASPV